MVRLRKMLKSDLRFLLEIRNHISTRKYLHNNNIFELSDAKIWYNSLKYPFYIIEAVELDYKKVGYFRTNGYDIGCDIHPDYRRRGYASDAFNLYLSDKDYATLWVFEENFAFNFYKKLGFKETGEFRFTRKMKEIRMEFKRK